MKIYMIKYKVMERTVIILSDSSDRNLAIEKIVNSISNNQGKPQAIIYFSDFENFEFYSETLHEKYPDTEVIGSTTYVNFTNDGISHYGISVLAIFSGIECSTGVLHDISTFPMRHVSQITNAVSKLSSTENTCCLEFTSAFSNGEEIVLDTFEEGLKDTGIQLAGSSAGAAENVYQTRVALNGKVYNNSCVFILLHNLDGRIFIHRENLFKPTAKTLVATDVDCENRVVYEYDEEPAADAIAKALEIPLEKFEEEILLHPVGRVSGSQINITSNGRVQADGSIVCYSKIYNRTRVAVLEFGDFENAMFELSGAIIAKTREPSFAIGIECISNSMILEKKKLFGKLTKTFSENFERYIGISGYGEQLAGVHLNQSTIVVVFE